ncbi:MAG: GTPase [bacterium]
MKNYKLSYPRHVKKAIDLFKIIGKKLNCLIWVADARLPFTTLKYINEFLKTVNYQKNIIIFVNKMDLVSKFDKENFIEYTKNFGKYPVFYGTNNNCKELYNYLKRLASKELFLNCIVVGLPNVGKSSLINCLSCKKKAEVADLPGTTRKLKWISVSYNIKILDFPGVVLPTFINEDELFSLLELNILNHSFVNVNKEKIQELIKQRFEK